MQSKLINILLLLFIPIMYVRIGIEFKYLPPCSPVLHNKMKRSNYIASMFKNCSQNFILLDSPENHGYTKNESNQFEIEFFSGPQYPPLLENESQNLNEFEDDSSSGDENEINLENETDYESSSQGSDEDYYSIN